MPAALRAHASPPERAGGPITDGGFGLLLAVAAVGLALAPTLVLGAPREPMMGFVQRIFYYHVPCAFLTFAAAFLCAGGSAVHLFASTERARLRGDGLARSAAELTVVFGLCVLVTGPLWARKAWGVWWVWKDVRLMTTLVLWFIFVAYLFVRRYGGPGSERLAAGLALFAAADVPLIYTSVFFWRTQHPKAKVVATLDPAMRPAFYAALTTFTVLFVVLLLLRVKLESARRRLDDLHLEAADAGLLES